MWAGLVHRPADPCNTITQDYIHIDEALKLAATRTCEGVAALLVGEHKGAFVEQQERHAA